MEIKVINFLKKYTMSVKWVLNEDEVLHKLILIYFFGFQHIFDARVELFELMLFAVEWFFRITFKININHQ